jgi:hypothetical protein
MQSTNLEQAGDNEAAALTPDLNESRRSVQHSVCRRLAACGESLAIFYSPDNVNFTENWLGDLAGTSYPPFWTLPA